jgi:hypothetical protein
MVSNSNMALGRLRPVVAAAAALLIVTGIAHADTTDDQFLTTLTNDGLNVGPPDQLIAMAHKRCDANGLPRGADWFSLRYFARPSPFVAAISNINNNLHSRGLTDDQVVQFMHDAQAAYCPNSNG